MRDERASLALLLATTVTIAAAACGDASPRDGNARGELRGRALAAPVAMPDAVLTDTEGRSYDLREETAGRTTLLFFGYTHCPDVCPIQMANLAAVLDDLGTPVRDRVEVLFVTTDPERDGPDRLRSWLDRFDPDFVGLSGPPGTVERIQSELNLMPAMRQDTGDGAYLVGHASQVVAFDPDGEARIVYPFGTRQADWAHDLPILTGAGDAAEG